ncbi:antichymotrypsin-2-like [Penaeus japonicus]|uniref:antichymotrypsin-2-like n=1 Tax=Penaeus japonicus TaxID=27405 RepID=UPI001C7140B4|nr:antichymotrypsin-2-like [Penaeus japonicus]
MKVRECGGESKELDAQVLEMAYKGGAASMIVLLPRDQNTGRELDELVQRLSPSTLTSALSSLSVETVELKFPKFKFEKKIEAALKQALVGMGISDLFSNRADLTNFLPDGGLRATDIIHKAVVEVDEEGAEAAAATAIVFEFASLAIPPKPIRFTCDRPFLFLIRDNGIDNILFMGAYRYDPAIFTITGTDDSNARMRGDAKEMPSGNIWQLSYAGCLLGAVLLSTFTCCCRRVHQL